MERFCKGAIFGISILISCIPLVVTNQTFFPVIVGKVIFFRVLVEIMVVFWIVLLTTNVQYRPSLRHIGVFSLICFYLALFITSLFGVDFWQSFWSTQERMLGLFTLLHFVLYSICLSSVLKTWKEWKTLFTSMLSVSVIVFLVGLDIKNIIKMFTTGYTWQMGGVIGNPIYVAAYASLCFSFSLFLFFKEQKKLTKLLYGFFSGVNFLMLLFAASRGPLIGLLVAFGIVIPFVLYIGKVRLSKKATFSIEILIIVAALSTLFLVRENVREFVVHHSPTIVTKMLYSLPDSLKGRSALWSIGVDGFLERPLFGWGWENFSVIFNKHSAPYIHGVAITDPWIDRSHNQAVDILALSGIIGFLSYIFFIFGLLYCVWRCIRLEEGKKNIIAYLVLVILIISYFIQNLSVFESPAAMIVFYTCIAYLFSQFQLAQKESLTQTQKSLTRIDVFLSSFLIGIAILSIYHYNLLPFIKSTQGVMAIRVSSHDFKKGFEIFRKSLSSSTFVNVEIRQKLAESLFNAREQQSLDPIIARESALFAIQEISKTSKDHPFDVRALILLSYLERYMSQYDRSYLEEAEGYITRAYALSPKRKEVSVEFAEIYFLKNEYEKAIDWSTKALSLVHKNVLYIDVWRHARLLARIGKSDEAFSFMIEAKKLGYSVYSESRPWFLLVKALPQRISQEKYEKLGQEIEIGMTKYPSMDYRAARVLLWSKMGNQKMTEHELLEIEKESASAATEIRELLLNSSKEP